jgi:hypothetical protein
MLFKTTLGQYIGLVKQWNRDFLLCPKKEWQRRHNEYQHSTAAKILHQIYQALTAYIA